MRTPSFSFELVDSAGRPVWRSPLNFSERQLRDELARLCAEDYQRRHSIEVEVRELEVAR